MPVIYFTNNAMFKYLPNEFYSSRVVARNFSLFSSFINAFKLPIMYVL